MKRNIGGKKIKCHLLDGESVQILPNQAPPDSSSPLVLIVDDEEGIRLFLSKLIEKSGCRTITAASGEEALELFKRNSVDLILSDVRMPGINGVELCRRIRTEMADNILPFILMTGNDPSEERLRGLEAGCDDFLPKPLHKDELLARVKSLLRIKALYKRVAEQTTQLNDLNHTLEIRVREQVAQLEKMGRLKRFLAPQVAQLVTSDQMESAMKSHRRDVSVLFVDLRGFTRFSEQADPTTIIAVLQEYYKTVGELGLSFQGTLAHFAGDGIMIFFNDPFEIPDHQTQAAKMAIEVRKSLELLQVDWDQKNYGLSYGMGVTEGMATIGAIGFGDYWNYSIIGSVANLAARLCQAAQSSQILVTNRFLSKMNRSVVIAEPLGEMTFKGVAIPVNVFNLQELL